MAARKRQRTVRFPRQRTVDVERTVTADALAGDGTKTLFEALQILNRLRLRLHDWQPTKGAVSCKLGRGWTLVVPFGPGEQNLWLDEYRQSNGSPLGPGLVLKGRSTWHWKRATEVVLFLQRKNLSHRLPDVLRTVEQARRELIRNLEERTRWL